MDNCNRRILQAATETKTNSWCIRDSSGKPTARDERGPAANSPTFLVMPKLFCNKKNEN